ncbi:LLM class flavin-dependent oxidoreductase [Streptomyces sp. NPDC046261]|uniref:LLM class flavin-dependent oxidoreductase n=1 Tax=Streptomyces sp. NPDC046261 TaxID=3157200 RepID=UPI0033C1D8D1
MKPADDLRFGVLLTVNRHAGQSDGDALARAVAVAQAAEALGLDDVWLTEHHFLPSAVSPSAMAFAAFLLGRTRRVRIGTAVTVLPLHSPVHIAEQTALLDQISGGRFVLGVGRGVPGVEYELMGEGIAAWHAGLAEPLDRTLAALHGEIPRGPGPSASVPVRLAPAVRTRPHPPVYVAAGSVDSIELAADRGLPLMLFFDKNAEAKAEMLALYGRRARAAGQQPEPGSGHAFAVFAQVTDSAAEARRLMRERARFILSLNNQPQRLVDPDRPAPPPLTGEAIDLVVDRLMTTHPVGTARTCAERLAHDIATSGCRRVMCQVEAAEGTAEALHNLRRLATEVFPAVRERLRTRAARVAV